MTLWPVTRDAIAVTLEARVAFILFFFLVWCLLGLIPWAVAAVMSRGRGALFALPLALAAAAAAGVFIPLVGLRDATGFFLSLPAALVAGALGAFAGIRLARRLAGPAGKSASAGPADVQPPNSNS